ncbi:MAG: tetratricopeptide repeat protein, partial [Bacteroidota bacterium]|nr:tetratricopeptide repeat protein [Bacteroidota bacterium]
KTIASELNATISQEEQNRMEKIPTANLTAYNLYLKAGSYYKDYRKTKHLNSYSKAVTIYKAALDLDSTFARAYSDLANVYLRRYFWETYFKQDFLDSCIVLAKLALSFDPNLDEAWQVIGRCCFEKGDIDGALRNYNKAIEINPEYSDALAYKGYLLTSLISDYVMGIDAYQKAVRSGPPEYTPDLLRGLGQAFLDVGIIDSTRSCYRRAYEFDGNKGLYLLNLSDIEFCLENFNEAIRLGYEAFKVDSAYYPENSYFYGDTGHVQEAYLQAKRLIKRFEKSGELNLDQAHRIGYAFWRAGKYEQARNFFEVQINYSRESIKLKRMISQYRLTHYDLAGTYAFLGDRETAYKYLKEFDRKTFYPLWWVTLAKYDPLFNSIRNDEKFQKILFNMQVKYQAEHDRVKKWLEGGE